MKKIRLAVILISLVISSLFVSSSNADNVIITVKGGFGCTISVYNTGNYTINATMTVVSHQIFIYGGTNTTWRGEIYAGETVGFRSLKFGLESVYAMAHAEKQTVIRQGISIFNFVILFR
jgi:hypothetical protein